MIRPRLRTQNGMGMGQNLSPMGPQILVYIYIFFVCTIKKSPEYWDTQFWPIPIASSRSFKTPAMPRYPKSPVWSARADSPQELAGPGQNSSEASRFFTFSYIFLLIPPVVTRGWLENGWEWRIYYGFLTAFPIQPCLWSAIFHCHVWLPNGTHSRTPRMNRFLTSHRWLLQPNRLGNADTLVYVVFWRTYDGRTPTEKIPFCCELTALPCPKSEEYPQKRSSPWDAIKHWFTPIKTKLKVLGIVIPKAKLENKRFKPPTMPFMGQSLL